MKLFHFRVKDDSMDADNISYGDVVVIQKQSEVCDDDIALVYAGSDQILRRIRRTGSKYILIASNATVAATVHDNAFVLGKAIGRMTML